MMLIHGDLSNNMAFQFEQRLNFFLCEASGLIKMKMIKLSCLLLLVPALAFAQNDEKFASFLAGERALLPVAGTELYNGAIMDNYRFGGADGSDKQVVDADPEMPFGKAMRLCIPGPGANPWNPQFQTPTNRIDIKKGDYLFFIFYARAIQSSAADGLGQGNLYVQRAGSPWTGLGSQSLIIPAAWHKYYALGQANEDYAETGMEVTIHLGLIEQEIEISGIIGLNLGPDVIPSELPSTKIIYAGMEENAAWRVEARARIEQYRKGDITVVVKNRNGQAIENARVRIDMIKHDYRFGTIISRLVLSNNVSARRYREHFREIFNTATTPFYMGGSSDNWGWYGSGESRSDYQLMADWLQTEGIHTKGHVLVWPGWQWMPSFFEALKNDPEALKQAIDDHLAVMAAVGRRYGLAEWDVINEPYINHDVMDILGDDIMVHWYTRVHALDSVPRLILNEYNILSGGGRQDFQDNLARVIELLLAEGAPVGGIGMQCHFNSALTGIPRILEILDRFSQYGLPVQITEFDIDIDDEEIQAAYTRDFYTAVFSHPSTDKICMWGFWEGDMWRPRGALIRTDWTCKPSHDMVMDLIHNQWETHETGASDRDGICTFSGFLGGYSITAEADSVKTSRYAVLTRDGLRVELTLAATATGVENNASHPAGCRVLHNHPNPFNMSTQITFTPAQTGTARLLVFNVRGRQVMEKLVRTQAGIESIEYVNLSGLPAGSYFYALEWPDGTRSMRRMMLMK